MILTLHVEVSLNSWIFLPLSSLLLEYLQGSQSVGVNSEIFDRKWNLFNFKIRIWIEGRRLYRIRQISHSPFFSKPRNNSLKCQICNRTEINLYKPVPAYSQPTIAPQFIVSLCRVALIPSSSKSGGLFHGRQISCSHNLARISAFYWWEWADQDSQGRIAAIESSHNHVKNHEIGKTHVTGQGRPAPTHPVTAGHVPSLRENNVA